MKIFLSSTYQDLLEYRAAAANAIERLLQQGIRMEIFGARPNDAREVCFREIEEADAIVGIYAHWLHPNRPENLNYRAGV